MLLSFPYTINYSEEMLVLSGYSVRADEMKELPRPEQRAVSLSQTFPQVCV